MEQDKYTNKEVSQLLRNMAASYLILGENRFKILAYQKAADAVESLNREIKDLWDERKLNSIPSIGPSIYAHLDELFSKGESSHFKNVMAKIPPATFNLMRIPGIGPKTAIKLVQSLHLSDPETAISELKRAAIKNSIAPIETFGEKSQTDIIEAIDRYERFTSTKKRMTLPYALLMADEMLKYLKKSPFIKRADLLGSLRRMETTIGDIDIVVQVKSQKLKVKSYKAIIDYFIKYPKTIIVENAGEKKASIILHPDIRVDIRVEQEKSYGSMLQYFTGNKAHNIKLRNYALERGFSLSEYGIKKVEGEKLTAKRYEFDNEEELYTFMDLDWIPPELRQGSNEIELAAKRRLPELIDIKDIKGDLHIHSSYNLQPSHDLGADDYKLLALNAKRLGYKYVGFTDHNPRRSLNDSEIISILKKRKNDMAKILSDSPVLPYFIGLEVDIMPTGELSIPEKAIEFLDYMIVSVHSVFSMPRDLMTERVLKALRYPKVKILGHPTGRLINKREGFDLEWDRVFDNCKNRGIAMEINSGPDRLDLPDLLVREAVDKGIKTVINTDAHGKEAMSDMFYGISVARRGWAKKNDVVNTMEYPDFKKWLTESQ